MTRRTVAPSLAGNVLGSVENGWVIAEWRDPGGPTEPRRLIAPRHFYRSDDEAWYVLEGTLCLERGSQKSRFRPVQPSSFHVERRTPTGIRLLRPPVTCLS